MMSWKPDVHWHLYFRNLIFNSAVTYQLNLGYQYSATATVAKLDFFLQGRNLKGSLHVHFCLP